jgi:peptidoglycan/xylan/chitin deacetylase (PgdA/CDA1 family)
VNLFLRRAAVLSVAAVLVGGIAGAASWKLGKFNDRASTATATPVAVPFSQQAYLAKSNWQAGTAFSNASAVPPDGRWPAVLPKAPKGVPVLANSCSAGSVTFTFDDGPDQDTLTLASELLAEHVPAVFFEIGDKVTENPGITRLLAAHHFVIGNHTYTHESLTGQSLKTKPLTDAQVKAELTRGSAAITSAGAPRPALWRAPYDDVSQHDEDLAAALGLRLVMSYGTASGGNIEDSQDWNGNSPASIAAHVDTGYTLDGEHFPGMRNQSILSFHDGTTNTALNTVRSIPLIVTFMNAHHLCATSTVRPNATGGVVDQTHVSTGNG